MFSPLRATSSSVVSSIFCLSSLALRFVSSVNNGVGVRFSTRESIVFFRIDELFRLEDSILIGAGVLKDG